ncbi:MAG: hypothetical protein WCF57_04430 [Pyrinomonadaceae bacterium]
MNRERLLTLIRSVAPLIMLALLAATPALSQNNNSGTAASQQPAAAAVDEKAEQIIKRGIEVMGGSAYLNVRSVVGQGLFTQFREGQSGLPTKFIDYIVYPDRERTEFRGSGVRIIQTNTGDTGWVYDGASKTLKDATPEGVEEFRLTLRVGFDNLLRGAWRKEGAKLSYAGRREAGLAQRNETVRIVYPDGLAIEFEFSARSGLPAKVIYKRKNQKGEETTEEDRLAQHVTVNGIVAPFIIDHFRDGAQTSRVNYESLEFNRPIDDALFAKPANAKAIK